MSPQIKEFSYECQEENKEDVAVKSFEYETSSRGDNSTQAQKSETTTSLEQHVDYFSYVIRDKIISLLLS